MEEKKVLLRLKAGTHELPHRVRDYEFTPDAEVPEKFAQGLMKTYPGKYEIARGKADLEKYTFKKQFQVNEIQKVLDQLNEEGRLDVYEYAKSVLAKEKNPPKEKEKEKEKDGK